VEASEAAQPPLPITPPPLDVTPTVDRWREKLLDFSARNRGLFYRPTQRTVTLHLSERELWNLLSDETTALPLDLTDDLLLTPETNRPDAPQDVRLRSLDAAKQRLRGLNGAARTFLEEQGVHVLHLPIGWLSWPDETRPPAVGETSVTMTATGKRARLVKSPLLFLPVTLERSNRDWWRVGRAVDQHVEPNLTLLGYLQSTFKLDVPVDEDDDLDLDAVLGAFADAIGAREHWSVALGDVAMLDTFSFKRMALLRELERSQDLVASQPVLRALCGDAAPLQAASEVLNHEPLDEKVDPADVALAVDADSSQLRAVLTVLDGTSLVIQGPPGTGKSQTITNLVSSATARGKRVLFVAEKKAARDVVVGKLNDAGISDLVLHITEEVVSGKSSQAKKDIAEQFHAILEQGPGTFAVDAGAPGAFVESRAPLNAYVAKLHTPLNSAAWSTPYKLMEAWAGAQETLLPETPVPAPSIYDVTQSWLDGVNEAAAKLDDLGVEMLQQARGAWWRLTPGVPRVDNPATVQAALETLKGYPGVLSSIGAQIGYAASRGWNGAEVAELARLLLAMETTARMSSGILRFLSPGWWSANSAVKAYLKRGGRLTDDASGMRDLARQHAEAWQRALATVQALVSIDAANAYDASNQATPLLDALVTLPASQAAHQIIEAGAPDEASAALLLQLVEQMRAGLSVADVLVVVLLKRWAAEAAIAAPEFAASAAARARQRTRLAEADRDLRKHAYAAALNAFAPHRPGMDTVAPPSSELGILKAQVAAKRRKPLRWLFSNAAGAILRLKPCIVASPLAVAQFLGNRAYQFDIVIFDEASQIPTADAVVPITRGKQIVVVGDSQQMPPTSFFDRALGDGEPEADDEFEFESVLQECEALLPSRRLLWHYRSRDERLIAFSNQKFYNGLLRTFPAAWAEHPALGVKFEYVEGAVYGRGGSRANNDEAQRLVKLLIDEIRADPEAEINVTAMSIAQQAAINDRIESDAPDAPELQAWLDDGNRVKNLETVQGDECDVMLLSLGYGKDAAGVLTLNFGPLSRDNGYRRLNVAVTRARRKTVLVTSLRAADIPLDTAGPGVKLVRQYLDYAERGAVALSENLSVPKVNTYDSPFEEEVASHLRTLGWQVDSHVGVGSYRVDLGVRDPKQPGRYIAGIECDGAAYHAAESARDRDIVRQRALENLQWQLIRVWSPDWYRDSHAVVTDLDRQLREKLAPAPVATGTSVASNVGPRAPEPAFRAAPDLPAGAVIYKPHVVSGPTQELYLWLASLVQREGPLHEDELFAALRQDFGYSSLSSRVRYVFTDGLLSAEAIARVHRRGDWVWPAGLANTDVPVRVNRDAPRRKLDYYCDEELARAMQMACAESGRLNRPELVEATCRFLGISHTQAARERIDAVVELATSSGYIALHGDEYETLQRPA
jgi:very-short-patch-repair endonuclease